MDLTIFAFVAWGLSWVLYRKYLHKQPLKKKRNPDGTIDVYYIAIPTIMIIIEGFFGVILFPEIMIIQLFATIVAIWLRSARS